MLTLSKKSFESVQEIKDTFGIFLISETKIDSSFTNSQFNISKYRIFQKDLSNCGGELLFHIRQDLNCKMLQKYVIPVDFEILKLKLKISESNWLVIGAYKSPS